MLNTEKLLERCRSEGLKATPQRIAIFKALEGNRNHPSAESIYEIIRKDYPTVSLTTVYRTLETLVQMGELVQLRMLKGVLNYDPDASHHHHVICTMCKRVEDVFMKCPGESELPEPIRSQFSVDDCRVFFYGKCDKCRSRTDD